MKEALGDKVAEVKLSQRLKSHPVCLSTSGALSIEMEKVLNNMPTGEKVSSRKILEINKDHPVFAALEKVFEQKGSGEVVCIRQPAVCTGTSH